MFYDKDIETMPREQLRQLQLDSINRQLLRAQTVPAYKDKLPKKIESLDEMKNLPFTTKEDLRQNFPNSSEHLPRPQKLDELLDIAEKLADGKNFIRVDLYVINGDVYFSEFTFFSDAGFERFYPDEWDYTLGKWIDL